MWVCAKHEHAWDNGVACKYCEPAISNVGDFFLSLAQQQVSELAADIQNLFAPNPCKVVGFGPVRPLSTNQYNWLISVLHFSVLAIHVLDVDSITASSFGTDVHYVEHMDSPRVGEITGMFIDSQHCMSFIPDIYPHELRYRVLRYLHDLHHQAGYC